MAAVDHVLLPDGRRLDLRVSGPADGLPLVFHHGTPGAVTPFRALERAAEISVPTMIWQGSADLMVPFAHGQWLAAQLPGASAHLVEGGGHLSGWLGALDRMLDEFVSAASPL